MRRNRIIFLAILGVALAIVAVSLLITQGTSRVTGLVGSEKAPFFEDERVQKALRRHGLEVTVQKAGSREIATSFDLSQYDFAFPAGRRQQVGHSLFHPHGHCLLEAHRRSFRLARHCP